MSGELAVRVEARPVAAALEFTDDERQMIRDTFANGANDSEFKVLMAVATTRRLNPLLRQIHFVSRFDSKKNRQVWATQVSIDGLRAIAQRTGLYDGQDEPEFVEAPKGGLLYCRVRVYRKDWTRPAVGVAYWAEYVQGGPFWQGKPHVMLSKCAESIALRKAFPEDTSGLYTAEEMGSEPIDVEAEDVPPVKAAARRVVALDKAGADVETRVEKIEAEHKALPRGTSKAALNRAIIEEREAAGLPVAPPSAPPANDSIPVSLPVTGKATGKPAEPSALDAFKSAADAAKDEDGVAAAYKEHRRELHAAGSIDDAKKYAVQAVASLRNCSEMDAANWLSAQFSGPKNDGPGKGPRSGRKAPQAQPPADATGSGEHAVGAEGTVAWLRSHLMAHATPYAVGASWAKHRGAFVRERWAEARGVVLDRMIAVGADPMTAGAALDGIVADFERRKAERARRMEAA